MTIYPAHWPSHEAIHSPDCIRCQLEADWDEQHDDCACLDHPWKRVDIRRAPSQTPNPQWVCSVCLRVLGPALAGGGS